MPRGGCARVNTRHCRQTAARSPRQRSAACVALKPRNFIFDEDILLISEDGANLLARSTPIAFSVRGKVWVNNHADVLRFPDAATQKLVETYLNSISIAEYVTGSARLKVNQKAMSSILIPLPPLAAQREIVAEIEAEQRLVEGNRQLIGRMEQKIAAALSRIWGQDAPTPTKPIDYSEAAKSEKLIAS